MAMRTQVGEDQAYRATGPVSTSQGVKMLEERVGVALEKVAHISSMLRQLEERLYAARPHKLDEANSLNAIPVSLENSINTLNSSLNSIQELAQRLLEG